MKTTNIRLSLLLLILLSCLLNSCASSDTVPPHNPMGLSGAYNKNAEINFDLARVLWGKTYISSNPLLAIDYLNKSIKADPNFAEAYAWRGLARSEIFDWNSAFKDLSAAIRLETNPKFYAFRGLVFTREGNFLGAKKDLDKAIALDKNMTAGWKFRGELFEMQEDFLKACSDYEKACSLGDCLNLQRLQAENICK